MRIIIKNFINHFNIRYRFFRSLPNNGKILDLGCGNGINGKIIKSINANVEIYGVDIVHLSDLPNFYNFSLVNIEKEILPYPDSYFDSIIFTHVIEHLHNPFMLAKEINRVLKNDATIYIEAPNWTTLLVPSFGFKREQHNPFNFYDDPTHIKPWTKQGLFEYLFQYCNFKVLKVSNTRNWFRIPLDIFIIFYSLFSSNRSYLVMSFWNLFGWSIYAIGRKSK